MGIGRSSCVIQLTIFCQPKILIWDELIMSTKPFNISKSQVWQAYLKVKSNKGGAGLDKQTMEDFDKNRNRNLYKIWNRMASGSYFPEAIKAVPIPKKSGGTRVLGIPTISDRIAQMVVKQILDDTLDPIFHTDSYGYRPSKSAHDALAVTRKRCWKYNWGIEFDIRSCFDNIDHVLLMKAVEKHIESKWVKLYLRRWLTTPLVDSNGKKHKRSRGIPQGGVVSPCLMNLFLHYVFDAWMSRNHSNIPWCRYADDGLAHCVSEKQALFIKDKLIKRFEHCGLELHPDKTKVFYCKDGLRRGNYSCITFDFLGYTFQPRIAKDKRGGHFTTFLPAVSKSAMKAMRQTIRRWKIQLKSDKSLEDLSRMWSRTLQGWANYYGKFYKSILSRVWKHFDAYLLRWAMHKFKRFRRHRTRAIKWLRNYAKDKPIMFPHWKLGFNPWAG